MICLITEFPKNNDYRWGGHMVKLEDLYKKYPFIYEVDEKYYYIGWGICKECTSKFALSYYEDFKKTVEEVGEEILAQGDCNKIDEDQLDSLLYFFRKVKAYSDIEVDSNDMPTFRKQLNDFLDGISLEEKQKLQHQLEIFVDTFHYYYKRW